MGGGVSIVGSVRSHIIVQQSEDLKQSTTLLELQKEALVARRRISTGGPASGAHPQHLWKKAANALRKRQSDVCFLFFLFLYMGTTTAAAEIGTQEVTELKKKHNVSESKNVFQTTVLQEMRDRLAKVVTFTTMMQLLKSL